MFGVEGDPGIYSEGMASEVDAWFEAYDNPMKAAMQRVREVILEEPRITECIKWKTPTFVYEGNMASFNPRAKKQVSLLFHQGASIPGDHRRLAGGGDVARYMTFADLADVEAAADELRAVTAAWCDAKD
jgi:hypothetical protein